MAWRRFSSARGGMARYSRGNPARGIDGERMATRVPGSFRARSNQYRNSLSEPSAIAVSNPLSCGDALAGAQKTSLSDLIPILRRDRSSATRLTTEMSSTARSYRSIAVRSATGSGGTAHLRLGRANILRWPKTRARIRRRRSGRFRSTRARQALRAAGTATPRADSALASICSAFMAAAAYISAGLAWSTNLSGSTIER